MRKSILVLTPGDPDGIGPEITLKAHRLLYESGQFRKFSILCVGAKAPFERLGANLTIYQPGDPAFEPQSAQQIWILPAPEKATKAAFLPGFQAGWSIEKATQFVLKGQALALVTGPISKERLQKGGFNYPGHTEFLAQLCGRKEVTMMLANHQLRVSLVTTHLAIQDVSGALSIDRIRRAVVHTLEGLQQIWKITRPKIAVMGLNPHCGESGIFGREELDLISPCIQALQSEFKEQAEILGPFPADTFFARQIELPVQERFDAVVCMYHDQGLIPVKLLDFHRTVNVTLGLPMIRTSVDHGVGFDIVGKGIANPSSLLTAIEIAARLTGKQN